MGLFEYVFLENGSKISINFLVWNMVSLQVFLRHIFIINEDILNTISHCSHRNVVKLFSSVV